MLIHELANTEGKIILPSPFTVISFKKYLDNQGFTLDSDSVDVITELNNFNKIVTKINKNTSDVLIPIYPFTDEESFDIFDKNYGYENFNSHLTLTVSRLGLTNDSTSPTLKEIIFKATIEISLSSVPLLVAGNYNFLGLLKAKGVVYTEIE